MPPNATLTAYLERNALRHCLSLSCPVLSSSSIGRTLLSNSSCPTFSRKFLGPQAIKFPVDPTSLRVVSGFTIKIRQFKPQGENKGSSLGTPLGVRPTTTFNSLSFFFTTTSTHSNVRLSRSRLQRRIWRTTAVPTPAQLLPVGIEAPLLLISMLTISQTPGLWRTTSSRRLRISTTSSTSAVPVLSGKPMFHLHPN